MQDVDVRISIFREMVTSVSNIFFCELDDTYDIIYSNMPNPNILQAFFSIDTGKETMDDFRDNKRLGTRKGTSGPVIYTNSVGMTWMSDVEYQEKAAKKVHLLGPVFLDDYSVKLLEQGVNKLQLSVKQKHGFMNIIHQLPVVPLNRLYEYGIMLRCCLTGEKIGIGDFVYADVKDTIPEWALEEKHGTYMMETKLLKLIEEGNLEYRKVVDEIATTGNWGNFATGDHLRQAQNRAIVFCALCSRAAINGGIATEVSFVLREQYINRIEKAVNIGSVSDVCRTMMDDYIRRVYRSKKNTGISSQIQESCDYICINLGKKLDIHTLASRLGYSDYYFSNRFKKEVGMSVRDFTMKKKIEKAMEYLQHSNLNIQDISNELGFTTQSYFGEVFRAQTGISPGEYRLKCKDEKK